MTASAGADPGLPDLRLEVLHHLDPDEIAAVARLVDRATEADGVRPLSEHVALHLRHGGDEDARSILAWRDGRDELAGYAHVDTTDAVAGASAELVVDPRLRGQGIGRRLVAQVLAESPDGRLRLWSHGDHPGAVALAEATGLERSRMLWQMRRSLYAPVPPPELPAGVTVRAFEPGRDDEAWLALNAKAFARHPEQGGWTLADLQRRLAEPWFDPAGFFLAEEPGPDGVPQLVAFHWTKVHGGGHGAGLGGHGAGHSRHGGHGRPGEQSHDHAHDHEPIGEVYVVGVDPDQQGRGLGRAMTLVGLRHLRSLGLPQAMLYVDGDNAAAIGLYTGLGFTHWDTDVMFSRGPADPPPDA